MANKENVWRFIQYTFLYLECIAMAVLILSPFAGAKISEPNSCELWNNISEFEEVSSLRKFLIEREWISENVQIDELDYILVLTRQLQANFFPDVPVPLVLGVISVESGFQKDLNGFSNEIGLMQIIPRYHTERIKKYIYDDNCDLFDPRVNLMVGMDYLNEMLHEFEDDISGALMAYNMGPVRARNLRSNGWVSGYAEDVMERMDEIWIFLERR